MENHETNLAKKVSRMKLRTGITIIKLNKANLSAVLKK